MVDWLVEKVVDLLKDSVKDGFDPTKFFLILGILLIGACINFRKQIRGSVKRFYQNLRQQNKINELKNDLRDIGKSLSNSLERLEINDEEFKQKINKIIEQINNLNLIDNDEVAEGKNKTIINEVKTLGDIYEQSIEDVQKAVEIFRSRVNRADRMAESREERINRALEQVSFSEKVKPPK